MSKGQPSFNSGANSIKREFDFVSDYAEQSPNFRPNVPAWAGGVPKDQHQVSVKVAYHIFRHRVLENKRSDMCAVFEWSSVNQELEPRPLGDIVTEARLMESLNGDVEQSVLVKIIKFPEQPQKRREVWVRAIVRLYGLDSCPHRNTQRTNPLFEVMKLSSVTSKREGEFIGVGRRVLPRFVDGDGVDKMIETTPQIVYAIPKHEREVLEVSRHLRMEEPAVTGTIGVDLLGDDVILRLQPGSDFSVDAIQTFISPSEFSIHAGEV